MCQKNGIKIDKARDYIRLHSTGYRINNFMIIKILIATLWIDDSAGREDLPVPLNG
jgi:hypothetical protein